MEEEDMASPERSHRGPTHLYHHKPQIRAMSDFTNPAMPILRLAGRSSLRCQFWLLCFGVMMLVAVYGVVFWDTMSHAPRFRVRPHQWEHQQRHYDIHLENLKRELDVDVEEAYLNHPHHDHQQRSNTVALGCAITTRMYKDLSVENMQYRLPLLRTLVPSFCNTASIGFDYHFYVAFDVDDANLQRSDFLNAIYDHFQKVVNTLCPKESNVTLHFVQCSHSHNPAWAQNDAMMEAYLDNVEFYYRVNDDTLMLSPGWTESYIEALQGFDPPYIGVVGPVHRGGNEFILTYDFVHKTHIDIFGYYYPRLFTDWWADDWMTAVYGSEKTIKLPGVRLKHTQEAGQRYQVQFNNGELVHYQVAHDRKTLNRYIYSAKQQQVASNSSHPSKVISMSLWGNDPKYTFGTIRNAQLTPVFFPGWTLRVYVEQPRGDRPSRYRATPKRVINKLMALNAQITYVNTEEIPTAPMLWRFLAADDMSLDHFIIRDADARLQDRDAAVVKAWLETTSPFHCVRDHPSHSSYALSGGMWGARPRELHKVIPIPWKDLMMGYRDQYGLDMTFLANLVWRKVEPIVYCHDSYSCKKWTGSHPFPVRRRGTEHVGQVFDAFGYARDIDMKIIRDTPSPSECVVDNATFADLGMETDVMNAEVVNSAQLKQLEEDIAKRNAHHQLEIALKDSLHVNMESDSVPSNHTVSKHDNLTFTVLGADNAESKTQPDPGMALKLNQSSDTQTVVWDMDYHIGPIRDVKYILREDGKVVFIDKSLAARCYLTNTCATNLKAITRNTGLSPSPELRKAFWIEYQNDPEMNLVTHFFCAHPSAMCELYIPFNKPMVVYITGRYEHGRYTRNQWESWNLALKDIAKDPRNMVIANNLYDANYLYYYTGFRPTVIAPLCSYVQTVYMPTKQDILIAPIQNPSFYDLFHGYLTSILKEHRESYAVHHIPDIYPDYKFSDIASHPAIIHIPYQVSTYTFCEHYAMNIPLFVPSVHLLATWHLKYDVLSQLTWNHVRGLLGDTRSIRVYNTNMSNPNNMHEVGQLKEWLKYADFYQRPHVIMFDSVRDLVHKLLNTDLKQVSDRMKQYQRDSELLSTQEWSAVFH